MRFIFVFCSFLLIVSLSGCNTVLLVSNTSPGGNTLKKVKEDEITGYARASSHQLVFRGKNFDYLISQGSSDIDVILNSSDIKGERLNVDAVPQFVINKSTKIFTGEVYLRYTIDGEDPGALMRDYAFSCGVNDCIKNIKISGTIHEKSKGYEAVFLRPIPINFYEYKYQSGNKTLMKVLLPVAITLDIITSPIQLIFFNIIE